MNFKAIESDTQFLTHQQGYHFLYICVYILCETCYQICYVMILCWWGGILWVFSSTSAGWYAKAKFWDKWVKMNVLKFGTELDRCGMKSNHLVNSLCQVWTKTSFKYACGK